jgi:hypothetical protein
MNWGGVVLRCAGAGDQTACQNADAGAVEVVADQAGAKVAVGDGEGDVLGIGPALSDVVRQSDAYRLRISERFGEIVIEAANCSDWERWICLFWAWLLGMSPSRLRSFGLRSALIRR